MTGGLRDRRGAPCWQVRPRRRRDTCALPHSPGESAGVDSRAPSANHLNPVAPPRRNTPDVTGVLALTVENEAAPAPSKADEEQAFINRCLAGDTEGFRPLVHRYQRIAFSVALRMLGTRADAEDVSQQAFVDAFAALDRFAGEGRSNAFATWLLRIVINRAKDVLKSKKRTEAPLEVEVASDGAAFSHAPASPEASFSQGEQRRLLEQALLRVPAKYREILIL